MHDHRVFDELLATTSTLDDAARQVQGARELQVDHDYVDRLVAAYQEWYTRALSALPEQLVDRFRDLYVGGFFVKRIQAFLQNPGAKNALFDENDGTGILEYWQHPYSTSFRSSLVEQRQIIAEAKQEAIDSAASDDLILVERLCRGFPAVAHALANRHADRPSLLIEDEYDVQDVFGGILRSVFADVRAEDPSPTRAGRSSRVDFVLKRERVVVEVKMTRPGLRDRQVGDQLIHDVERYRSHPECRALVAFIYDPSRQIVNARGLEDDLNGMREGLMVRAIVVQP